jgi:hypothetical protein
LCDILVAAVFPGRVRFAKSLGKPIENMVGSFRVRSYGLTMERHGGFFHAPGLSKLLHHSILVIQPSNRFDAFIVRTETPDFRWVATRHRRSDAGSRLPDSERAAGFPTFLPAKVASPAATVRLSPAIMFDAIRMPNAAAVP